MDLLEKLRGLKRGNEITLFEFINSLNKNDKCLHVFYEGKTDNGFYGSLVRRYLPENANLKTYVCGNKEQVYKVRGRLKARDYISDALVFLVDKDLDDLIPKDYPDYDDVHTTEFYSIENYIVCDKLFNQSCSESWKIDCGDKQLELITERFISQSHIFVERLKSIMAWAICCRRLSVRPVLANIKMKDIFELDENLKLVSLFANNEELFEYLSSKSKSEVYIFPDYIQEVVSEISSLDARCYIRGKYHLWFFVEFMSQSKKVLEKANGGKIKVHIDINSASALDYVGPRMKTPPSLEAFFLNHIEQLSPAA
ncbi:DUF4435 domain-containing protein [Vibrio genomosp. F6]|uniref:DUF4435 domain-containing protein n=1 Tax=Vibrio genomosp. F6 TaxID=723172 RepID=UPI001482B962|nr:DUF4435 domain-containing protein [Vibrio genomosp. F6]